MGRFKLIRAPSSRVHNRHPKVREVLWHMERQGYLQRRDPRTAETYYEHRAIAGWKLGRDLSPTEVAHHVNGDPTDNHPDNLWIFSSQRAHMLWHHYRWRQEAGVGHLFPFEEMLSLYGERLYS